MKASLRIDLSKVITALTACQSQHRKHMVTLPHSRAHEEVVYNKGDISLLCNIFPDFNIRYSNKGDRMTSRNVFFRHGDDSSTQQVKTRNTTHTSTSV